MSLAVANFYLFVPLTQDVIHEICGALDSWAARSESRGLVVIAEEGINATLAGATAAVEEGVALIETIGGFKLSPKWSSAERQPFNRWKIDVRDEIVTLGFPCVDVSASPETFLTPTQWHDRLSDSSQPKPILIDTRNIYETELGTFEGSVDPRFQTFTDLLPFSEQHPELKEQEVFIFCTGGIRCEKAAPYLESKGFSKVRQLHGGILKYIEEYPNGHFKGECFVFDHRVALDQNLAPTKRYWLCQLCGDPGDQLVTCKRCGESGQVCSRCIEQQACSKDCRYHLNRVKDLGATKAESTKTEPVPGE